MSAGRKRTSFDEEWQAEWITRPAKDHKEWSGYAVEALVAVEDGAAAVLFGARDEGRYTACSLDANDRSVSFYTMEGGVRTELGRVPAPELEASPARVALRVAQTDGGAEAFVNDRPALTVDYQGGPGTIGLAAEAGGSAVFRDVRVVGEDGRLLYSNRFYDPSCLQVSRGEIDASGSGLRLKGGDTSLCDAPVPVDSPLFRTAFVAPADVVRAIARVYSTGWYEFTVNGRKADDRVLAPANTPYGRRLLYDVYDVTNALRGGGNALGLRLGNGYNHNYSRWGWKWKRDKAAILRLDIELANGETMRVATDSSWMTAAGPLLANDIYDGETYDARLETPGWDTYEFEPDARWSPAVPAAPPAGVLEHNTQPPVRPRSGLRPARTLRPRDGVVVYDFGQNVAGWVKADIRGAAGSRLTIKHSELVDEAGNLDPWTNRNAKATDTYIARGDGVETYEPRFAYHGFRYVEASGDAELVSLEAIPIRADVRETGRFACSDELINRIQHNLRWSYLNNLVSIPTDCCQRDERTPCLMDSAVVEEMGIHNFEMRLYYRKWLADIEYSDSNPDWSGDKVTLPWHLYWYYGDTEALERHYDAMKGYVDRLAERWPDGIVREGFGDWCPPNDDGWENYFREVEIVNTSLYCAHASIVSRAADALGRAEDRDKYAAHAERLKRAFRDAFHRGGGTYGSGSQTAQIMPLALGLVPEAHVAGAVEALVAAIAAKGNHPDTGIYGTRYLVDVLADAGRIDLAFEMLTQVEYPSFGWQISQGATTLWEQWSFKGGMHSHDHAMFGGVGASFYTRLGGIRALAPGYAKIGVEPHVPSRLEWVETSVETPLGRVASGWRKEAGRLVLEVEIPEGARAVVALPAARAGEPRRRVEAGPGKHAYTIPIG